MRAGRAPVFAGAGSVVGDVDVQVVLMVVLLSGRLTTRCGAASSDSIWRRSDAANWGRGATGVIGSLSSTIGSLLGVSAGIRTPLAIGPPERAPRPYEQRLGGVHAASHELGHLGHREP